MLLECHCHVLVVMLTLTLTIVLLIVMHWLYRYFVLHFAFSIIHRSGEQITPQVERKKKKSIV